MEKMSASSYYLRLTVLYTFFGFITEGWGIAELRKIVQPRHFDRPVASVPQEILALFTAIIRRKNVTINPAQYPINLTGKVRREIPYVEKLATLDSGAVLCRREAYDQISTSDICSVYFEEVVLDGETSTKLHVHTRNTDYLLGDIQKVLQSPFCKYMIDNNLEIEDYERFFSNINDDYQKIMLT